MTDKRFIVEIEVGLDTSENIIICYASVTVSIVS